MCGSAATNVGNITFTAATDATTTAYIAAGQGQTLQAFYTVPAGYTAFITEVNVALVTDATKAASARVALYSKPYALNGGDFGERIEDVFGLLSGGTSEIERAYSPFRKFEAQTQLRMTVTDCSASDLEISAGFDVILVRDDIE